MPQTVKRQSVYATVLDASDLARLAKASLHVRFNTENQIGLAIDRDKLSFKFFQLRHERRRNRDRAIGQRFSVGRYDVDLMTVKVNVRPLQFENLSESHSRGQGANKDRFKMCPRAGACGQQAPFFVVRECPFPSPFVGHFYQRIVFFKRNAQQPSFLLRLSQHGADQHQLPIDAGNGPGPGRMRFDYWSVQALLFVLLKLAMRERSQFVGAQFRLDSAEQIHLRLPGASAFDDSTVTVDGLNQVSILVPLGEFGKGFLRMCDGALIVFQFIKRLLEIPFCLRFIPASSPNSMALAIKSDVCSAGVDLPALFDNLQFPFAGHRVYTFVPEFGARFDFEDLEESPHGSLERAYNQEHRLFLIVSGCVGLLAVVLLALIVDQEVVGSSPTSRPKFPNKNRIQPIVKRSAVFVSTPKSPFGNDGVS